MTMLDTIQSTEGGAADSRPGAVYLALTAYDYATFSAPERVQGLVFLSDGEDGFWMAGFAYGADKWFQGQAWCAERGYQPTHFAPMPAAPVDGVTI